MVWSLCHGKATKENIGTKTKPNISDFSLNIILFVFTRHTRQDNNNENNDNKGNDNNDNNKEDNDKKTRTIKTTVTSISPN